MQVDATAAQLRQEQKATAADLTTKINSNLATLEGAITTARDAASSATTKLRTEMAVAVGNTNNRVGVVENKFALYATTNSVQTAANKAAADMKAFVQATVDKAAKSLCELVGCHKWQDGQCVFKPEPGLTEHCPANSCVHILELKRPTGPYYIKMGITGNVRRVYCMSGWELIHKVGRSERVVAAIPVHISHGHLPLIVASWDHCFEDIFPGLVGVDVDVGVGMGVVGVWVWVWIWVRIWV